MEKSLGTFAEKSADLYKVVFYKDQLRWIEASDCLGENYSIGFFIVVLFQSICKWGVYTYLHLPFMINRIVEAGCSKQTNKKKV